MAPLCIRVECGHVGNRKTLPTRASVPAFIAAIPDARRRRDCETMRDMMTRATGCKAVMWGTAIVGFGEHDYSYPETPDRSTRWFQAGFSPRKAALTVYLMGGIDPALVQALGLRASGGGCLYITDLAKVDGPALQKMIDGSIAKLRRP